MLSVLLSGGCTSSHVHKALMDVESFIMERPDSALTVLDSMDRSLLKNDRLLAHHALLHAMALDKNYIDVSDDSLASVALSYYSRKGPEKYLARAQYYLGLSYYYAGDYNKAILEFTKAEAVAEKSDSLYLGMTKIMQARTHVKSYNDFEELKCLEEAYQIFKSLNETHYINISRLYISHALFNIGRNDEAKDILKQMISDDTSDEKIMSSVLISYAFANAVSNNPDYYTSNQMYSQLTSEYESTIMTYKDYWVWAYSLNKLGRSSEACNLIEQLKDVDTSGTADYWMYMIEKSKGNSDKALRLLEKFTNKNNEDITKALQQSLALSQRDYYEAEFLNAEYKARNRKLAAISIGIAAVLVVVLVVWIASVYVRRQREEKEYYLNYADEIHRQLETSRNEGYPELKRRYLDIFKSRFEMIGSLYEEYVLYQGKKNAEHAVYTKVSGMIETFISNSDNRKQLESVLDESLDGIVAQLRVEMPKFKETDYYIFCLSLIGFDTTTISHFLNISMNAVYIRKSRMRQRIEEANPEHMQRFLKVLA